MCYFPVYQNTMPKSKAVHELTWIHQMTTALETDYRSHSTKLTCRLNYIKPNKTVSLLFVNDHTKKCVCVYVIIYDLFWEYNIFQKLHII